MHKYYNSLLKKSIIVFILGLLLPLEVIAKIPNDPDLVKQSFHTQINSQIAWNYATGSKNVIVAVIDVGVDIDHPDLKDNFWINSGEIADNGIDDDHNGYIDDVRGWNFVEDNNDVRVPKIKKTDEFDVISHGTIVAGLIGAKGDNHLLAVGINWSVSIMPIRAMANDGVGSFVDVAKAVDYAVGNGAAVVNLSIVSDLNSDGLKQAITRAWHKGVVVVAAAGNEGYFTKGDLDLNPAYPICYDNGLIDNFILGVASIESKKSLSNFSSYGSCVDLSAPGRNINSTLYYAPAADFNDYFGGQVKGTSFATPQVAGTAALLKSLIPDWKASEINNFIINNSDDISVANVGFEKDVGRGLNVGNVIKEAIGTVAYLRDSISNLYYQQGNQIYVYNTQSEKSSSFNHVSNEQLIDFSLSDINNDGRQEMILLINRGQFYYLQIDDLSGNFIKEYSLPREAKISGDYNRLELVSDQNNIFYILEAVNGEKKYLDKFSADVKLLESLEFNGQKWSAGINYAYVANYQNEILTVDKKDWSGQIITSAIFADIGQWLDFTVRDLLDWDGEEIIILANNQNITRLIIGNSFGSTVRYKEISTNFTARDWHLLFNSFNNLVWPVNLEGGKFPLLKNGYEWIGDKEIKMITGVKKIVMVK